MNYLFRFKYNTLLSEKITKLQYLIIFNHFISIYIYIKRAYICLFTPLNNCLSILFNYLSYFDI